MNRALANLRIRSYDRALKDVKLITEYDRPPEKALYRASQAQYYLGRFRHCFETLTKLLREYPGNEAAIREKARAQRRLVEQKHGRYEFRNMYDASKAAPLYLDHATHVGPVKVKKSEGRGRGLFITKNVVAGELLLCEKAFSYSYEEKKAGKSEDSSGIPMLANILTNRVTVGTQVDLMKEIIQKLKWNPCFLRSITALHHGSYIPVREADVDDHPVIDTYVPCRNQVSMLFHWHILIYKPSCLRCYCRCSHHAAASDICGCIKASMSTGFNILISNILLSHQFFALQQIFHSTSTIRALT